MNVKLLIVFFSVFLFLVGCSKEENGYFESKRIVYTFSAGGNDAQYAFYSNREGKTLGGNTQTLYSYQDEVRPGDKIILRLSTVKKREDRKFEIRVTMDEKLIFYSDEVNGYPSTIVISETLDSSLFKKWKLIDRVGG